MHCPLMPKTALLIVMGFYFQNFQCHILRYIEHSILNQAQKTGLLTAREPTGEVGSVHLTQRQREVLELLAKGAPIKRICKELDLSEGTVKTHVTAIYRAFGATNRTEALLEARRHGFDVGI